MKKPKSLYQILGVPKDADQEAIKKAYRKKSFRCHPDRNIGDERAVARFQELTFAYEVLSDPDRRRQYDDTGDTTDNRIKAESEELAQIMGLIHAAFITALNKLQENSGRVNLLSAIKQEISDKEREILERKEGIEKGLKEIETKFKQRFVRKENDGKENSLQKLISFHIEKTKDELKEYEKLLKIYDKAKEVLKEYVYVPEASAAWTYKNFPQITFKGIM